MPRIDAGSGWRDPSNTQADLRNAFTAAGFDWITSHVFRKTVVTRLDEAGLSARQMADHLGTPVTGHSLGHLQDRRRG